MRIGIWLPVGSPARLWREVEEAQATDEWSRLVSERGGRGGCELAAYCGIWAGLLRNGEEKQAERGKTETGRGKKRD